MIWDGYSITLEEEVLLDRAVYRGVQNGEITNLATLLHELVHVAQYIEGITPWMILRSYIATLSHDRSQFEIHADKMRERFILDMQRRGGNPCDCR